MQIPISKVLLWSSAYRLSLLGLGVFLVLIGAWSQLPNENKYLGKIYGQPMQRKTPSKGPNDAPVLAYWIFGSKGEGKRILRLLKAVYHPRNQYLLHLDADASDEERTELASFVQSENVFRVFANVNVVGKSYGVNMIGASSLAAMLHGAALLLKLNSDWDWFTMLSSSEYPLLSQDDILYGFTIVPKDLNFVRFANHTVWKEQLKMNNIVVDTSLYRKQNGPVFYAVQTRETPDAFEIYGGSPWMMLTRDFIEHSVIGWDNLPRKLLMYFTNTIDPLESYFHTVLCNSPEFQNTTVNDDLRYKILEPALDLRKGRYGKLISRGSVFARPFQEGDSMLENIDKNILHRQLNLLVTGNWCMNQHVNDSATAPGDFCATWDDIDSVNPGKNGMQLRKYLLKLTAERSLVSKQCSS